MKKLLNGLFNGGFPDFEQIINSAFDEVKQGFFLYATIGVLVSVIILLLINLVRSWKPTTSLFKFFNVINFVYFPVLFALVFGSYGALSFGKKHSISEVHDGVVPSLQVIFPTFQLYLGMQDDDDMELEDAVLKYANTIQLTTDSESWIEQKKIEVAQKEIPQMLYRGIQAMVDTEREMKNISEKKSDVRVAQEMAFLKVNSDFWNLTEEKLKASTSSHFTNKYLMWALYSIVLASLLILELILIRVVR